MRPHHVTYLFFATFLTTIFLLQWYQSPSYPFFVWALLGLLGCIGFLGLLSDHTEQQSTIMIIIILSVSLALFTITRTTHISTVDTVDTYATGQNVTLYGTIVDEPDKRPLKTKYTIAVEQIESPNLFQAQTAHGLTLVTDHSQWPEFHYGDSVIVIGKLEKPLQIEDFHYDRYLSRYGIYSVMYRAKIEPGKQYTPLSPSKLFTGLRNVLFTRLYSLKERFEFQINRLYSEPHASFLAGLLTGSRRGIPKHLLEDFNVTGLTHIIAISGYNITIIISLIAILFFFLPLQWRLFPSIIIIILFTFFVGASAAVVRAAIMGILGLLALHFKRKEHTFLTILWTASIMVLWNPKQLWYDAGFQLSFLAVIGLAIFGSSLQRWCNGFSLHKSLLYRGLSSSLTAFLFSHHWQTSSLHHLFHLRCSSECLVSSSVLLFFLSDTSSPILVGAACN